LVDERKGTQDDDECRKNCDNLNPYVSCRYFVIFRRNVRRRRKEEEEGEPREINFRGIIKVITESRLPAC